MNKQPVYLVYTLALIKFIFPFFLIDFSFQLHATEFINYDVATSFNLGYNNNEAPLLYWLGILQHQLGTSIMVLKLVPALFGALTYCFVGLIVVELGGKLFAVFLAFLPFILSIYLPIQFYYSAETLTICMYAAVVFAIIKHLNTKKNVWLYCFGLFLGFGLLSSNLFFITAIITVASFALTKQYRILYTNINFYIPLFIGILMYLPHLIWLNEKANFSFLNAMQTNLSFEAYSLQQLFFVLGGAFIWIIGILYMALTPKGREHLPLLISFLLTNFIFFINQIDAKNLLPLFSILIAFGAFNIERLTTRYVRILRYVSITPLFYVGFTNMPTYMPILPPDKLASIYSGRNLQQGNLLVWDDNSKHDIPQSFAEMIGYKEILEKVSKVYHGVNEQDKANTVIVCKNKALAAAVNFYSNDYQLPKTILANDDFYFTSNIKNNIVNVVFLGNPIPEQHTELYKNFENSYLADEFNENHYSKYKGTKIMLYLKANETLNNLVRNNNLVNNKTEESFLANK
jgi:hypothetical protein